MSSEINFLLDLVASVRQKRCLFDKKNANYYNKIQKDKAWQDISSQINKTPQECKSKWKILRERFVRELKKQENPSGSNGSKMNEWELFEEMLFLEDSVSRRSKSILLPNRTLCKEENQSSSSADEIPISISKNSFSEDFPTTSTPPPKKRTISDLKNQFGEVIEELQQNLATRPRTISAEEESDELFFKSLIYMVKGLPSSVKDEIKAETISLIVKKKKEYYSSL